MSRPPSESTTSKNGFRSPLLYSLPSRALEQRVAVQAAGVQERHVAGVDAAFERLQPVALLQPLRREGLALGDGDELPLGQRRLLRGIAEVRPEHVAALDQGVGLQLHVFAEVARLRLARHLDGLAGDVVLPAVIRAAQAALLVPAEPERDAAVRAELVDQAVTALGVPEREEPLREDLDPHRRTVVLWKLLRQQHGLPVATEELPHRRPRTRLGQQFVDLGAQHGRPRPFASLEE